MSNMKHVWKTLRKGLAILWQRLTGQGLGVTTLWATDHVTRFATGAPLRRVSQITPQLFIGGQYRRRGWRALTERGITAVINMRIEYDDNDAGIAPPRYLHLPTVDDDAPTLEHLRVGAAFIGEELGRGGAVYIHCKSGIGRAASMAAAYFVTTGLTPEEAWTKIHAVRPFVRPTPVQIAQIERFAAEG
jgi:predicted protein tyrosine phosphatase